MNTAGGRRNTYPRDSVLAAVVSFRRASHSPRTLQERQVSVPGRSLHAKQTKSDGLKLLLLSSGGVTHSCPHLWSKKLCVLMSFSSGGEKLLTPKVVQLGQPSFCRLSRPLTQSFFRTTASVTPDVAFRHCT